MRNAIKRSLLIFFVLAIFLPVPRRVGERPARPLEIDFLDVGQGDSTLITTPEGFQVLIDGGPSSQVLESLFFVMPFGDKDLDLVILSHPDADHLRGLVDVLRDYRVSMVMMPPIEKDTVLFSTWKALLQEQGIEPHFIFEQKEMSLSDWITLSFFHPTEETFNPGEEANNASIVLRLAYGQHSFLFTGDMEQVIEDRLVTRYGQQLASTALKVPHHGSKTSSSPAFLREVHPRLAIIEVGADNRYGHPHAEVLKRYESLKIPVFRTDHLGTIHTESNGQNLFVFCPQSGLRGFVGKKKKEVYNKDVNLKNPCQ